MEAGEVVVVIVVVVGMGVGLDAVDVDDSLQTDVLRRTVFSSLLGGGGICFG